ncbi:LOW QUALITY PROTEIN: taste receptor type 2 member 41 [Dugong dugon]
MHLALETFFTLLFKLLCLLGIGANSFSILALGGEWRRQGRLLPHPDLVLLTLGVACFRLQWVGLVSNFYYPRDLVQYLRGLACQLFGLHWDFLNTATFWLGAWLSTLFCTKIASLSHPAFLWLKWRLLASVPWLLLGSLAVSTVATLLFFWGNILMYQGFLTRDFLGNKTYQECSHRLEIHYFLPLKLVTLSVPCSLFLASMVLRIGSPCRHAHGMQPHEPDLQERHFQAHPRALTFLVSFLALCVVSFLSLIVEMIRIYLCTSIHPLILILGDLKLRGLCRQLLLLARGFRGA